MSEPARLSVKLRVDRSDGFALDVAFEAPPGITILFGPSGAGKSTILAAVAGLYRPKSGRVALGDDVWLDTDAGVDVPIHRRKVAFVFQTLALFPHLSAADNVIYGMDRAASVRARRARAEELLVRLRVGHLASRKPPTFSGGEAQRVALARAFAMDPRIVLFDEPFSAMDRELRRDLASDLRDFVDELGVPMIHVTHHRNEARALGDRVILLQRGRIAAMGSVDDLLPADPPEDASFADTPMLAPRWVRGRE
jgi:molybdate transport system ATP-binding protein